jgi:hypothetical protein
MKKLFFFLWLICLIAACSSSKINNSKDKFTEVRFGNYGGFSNLSTEYIITGDGQLSKVENNVTKPVKVVRKKVLREIDDKLKSIEFEKLRINDLGNITYFIKVKTSEYENTVRWNDETQNIELLNTYRTLIEILQ